MDRPGFGLSDYKEDRTLLGWPNDVQELADYLKIEKFAVMGCSGGGRMLQLVRINFQIEYSKLVLLLGWHQ